MKGQKIFKVEMVRVMPEESLTRFESYAKKKKLTIEDIKFHRILEKMFVLEKKEYCHVEKQTGEKLSKKHPWIVINDYKEISDEYVVDTFK